MCQFCTSPIQGDNRSITHSLSSVDTSSNNGETNGWVRRNLSRSCRRSEWPCQNSTVSGTIRNPPLEAVAETVQYSSQKHHCQVCTRHHSSGLGIMLDGCAYSFSSCLHLSPRTSEMTTISTAVHSQHGNSMLTCLFGITSLWWLTQAPIWLSLGLLWKYCEESSSLNFLTMPSIRT